MTAPIQPAQTKYAQRQAWAPKAAAPGRPKQGQPPRGWSLRLQTCLSRIGQATEAKRLASRGLQGLAQHTKWQAWGPHSSWLEFQRGGIHAVAQASGCGAIGKHMPEVRTAVGANGFGSRHAEGAVHMLFNGALIDFLREAGPAAT